MIFLHTVRNHRNTVFLQQKPACEAHVKLDFVKLRIPPPLLLRTDRLEHIPPKLDIYAVLFQHWHKLLLRKDAFFWKFPL